MIIKPSFDIPSLITGGLIVFLCVKYIPIIQKKYKSQTILIRSYWIWSLLIIACGIVMNIINYQTDFLKIKDFGISSDLINFYVGLVFAIYTGYTAFKQFQDSRYDKIKKDALDYYRLGQSNYERARRLFREAYLINPTDDLLVGDYAELMLILGDWDELERLTNQLKKIMVQQDSNITIYYFTIAKSLFKEHLKEAKSKTIKMLKYIDNNQNVFNDFSWGFSELSKSNSYVNLKGESKSIFQALTEYLSKKDESSQKALRGMVS